MCVYIPDVSSFTDCFSTHDEADINESPKDPITDDKYHLENKLPDDERLSLEVEKELSLSSSPDPANTIKESMEEVPTVNKPIK